MLWLTLYTETRARLTANPNLIVLEEKRTRDFLVRLVLSAAPAIDRDWKHAYETRPYWIEAAPKQRGNQPRGTGIPWIEVAECVPMSHISAQLARLLGDDVVYPGLPFGGDLRFSLERVLVHLDAKAAGPTDSHDEVVVPPFQVSGDGFVTSAGALKPQPSILNRGIVYPGRNKGGTFYPSLPPIYTYSGHTKLCVTAFLKVVYKVNSRGDQPLDHMTLVIVPNGILLSDHGIGKHPELFARGKDAKTTANRDKRCRVLFGPLADINGWRVTKFVRGPGGSWLTKSWK